MEDVVAPLRKKNTRECTTTKKAEKANALEGQPPSPFLQEGQRQAHTSVECMCACFLFSVCGVKEISYRGISVLTEGLVLLVATVLRHVATNPCTHPESTQQQHPESTHNSPRMPAFQCLCVDTGLFHGMDLTPSSRPPCKTSKKALP